MSRIPFGFAQLASFICVPAACCLGQGSFTPVSDMPGIVEPPVDGAPINASQVILGLAPRYVVARPIDSQRAHTAFTQDFVTFEDLAWPPNTAGDVLAGVSDDGTRIFSTLALTTGSAIRRAAIWRSATEFEILNADGNFNQNAVAISADGEFRLIQSGVAGSLRGFVQSSGGVTPVLMVDEEPTVELKPTVMSGDGSAVGGQFNGAPGPAFWWTQDAGGHAFSSDTIRTTNVRLISDGAWRIVYNPVFFPGSPSGYPTDARGHRRSIDAIPSKISRDGSLVAAYTNTTNPVALLWTETLGAVRLSDELNARGIDTRGWTLRSVRYISADGTTFVGVGRAPDSTVTRWWVAHVQTPFAAADIGKSGGVPGGDGRLDNNDLIVFVNRFFAADERADVGRAGAERGGDGALDNNDFCVFIDLFFRGVP